MMLAPSAVLLAAALQAPPADPERARVAAAQAELARLSERLRSTRPEQPLPIDGTRELEFPLSVRQIERARRARASISTPDTRRSPMLCPEGSQSQPLDVFFANYTLDVGGHEIPGSRGWTSRERRRFSRFLCQMLPLASEVYGEPFQRGPVTLVKDLYYTASWIFIPSTFEIHAAGSWNPRLLTHESLHAFRGQRGLTSGPSWEYDPTLSGFEEGFAEGLAYALMNEFVRRFCDAGQCASDVPSSTVWDSWLEGVYDFSNDQSLTTTDFWSDEGGTLKFYERYSMAAAALMRLETAIPSFSRRFNQTYYERIRADPSYRPTRAGVIALVESLTPEIDGVATGEWIGRQRIFDCRSQPGKKTWQINYTPSSAVDEWNLLVLMFIETFPGGSEWAELVPGCPLVPDGLGPWLYYRQHDTPGLLELVQLWDAGVVTAHPVRMTIPPDAASYRVRGCNDVVGEFGAAEVHLLPPDASCSTYYWPNPVCLERPVQWGLYGLRLSWDNPQHGQSSGPPSYAMPYDTEQATVGARIRVLAGRPPTDFDRYRHVLTGGIEGARAGQLRITHSARPGELVVPVVNGAFYAEPPTCPPGGDDGNCWVRSYAPWSWRGVTVPGTLRFVFEPADGSPAHVEERTIVFGTYAGRHRLLLDMRLRRRRGR
jgi:hypothetical protein